MEGRLCSRSNTLGFTFLLRFDMLFIHSSIYDTPLRVRVLIRGCLALAGGCRPCREKDGHVDAVMHRLRQLQISVIPIMTSCLLRVGNADSAHLFESSSSIISPSSSAFLLHFSDTSIQRGAASSVNAGLVYTTSFCRRGICGKNKSQNLLRRL